MDEWQFISEGQRDLKETLAVCTFDKRDFSTWVADKLEELGLQKNVVVRQSRLNQTFAYQIMAGTRNASRDKLIQLAFGMDLDIGDACELLERGGTNPLCPCVRRDVIIAFCLHHQLGLVACEDVLWDLGEATITTVAPAVRRDG